MRQRALTAELVVRGYAAGAFPMADADGEIGWFSPDPRGIFELESFHVPATLRKTVARGASEIRVNTAFADVIAACAQRLDGTWISPEIIAVYVELHRRGLAHSVESWRDGRLVGGLYGVTLGGAYFGESMFYRATDASKVALVALMERLRERGYVLVDTQWLTPHLERFGAVEIPREEYLKRLAAALRLERRLDD